MACRIVPRGGLRGVAHVAVPVLAGAADAGRLAAFRDVGQDDDLGVVGHAPAFTEDVELDLAEAARERDLLGGRDRLATEEDDTVFVVGALDRGERGVVEWPGEIHPGDLGAEHGCGRNDFHGALTSTTIRVAFADRDVEGLRASR